MSPIGCIVMYQPQYCHLIFAKPTITIVLTVYIPKSDELQSKKGEGDIMTDYLLYFWITLHDKTVCRYVSLIQNRMCLIKLSLKHKLRLIYFVSCCHLKQLQFPWWFKKEMCITRNIILEKTSEPSYNLTVQQTVFQGKITWILSQEYKQRGTNTIVPLISIIHNEAITELTSSRCPSLSQQ